MLFVVKVTGEALRIFLINPFSCSAGFEPSVAGDRRQFWKRGNAVPGPGSPGGVLSSGLGRTRYSSVGEMSPCPPPCPPLCDTC